jgi:predicted DCC family thiol-disulfide oxidoreductase YuxK
MTQPSFIIYDGDCIFCQNYTRLLRLRDAVGPVDLVNARSQDDPRVQRYRREGFDLDEGMLFVLNGRVYHGAEAVAVLADLSTDVSLFNRLNKTVLSNPTAARLIYPLLKAGRRATLFMRGKPLIS